MRDLERAAERAAAPFRVDAAEFERLAVLSTRRSKKGKEVLGQLGGDPVRIAAVLEEILEIQKTLRKREGEIRMDRQTVREATRLPGSGREIELHAFPRSRARCGHTAVRPICHA